MGWNELDAVRPSRLLAGLPEHPYVYFAHSYYVPVVEQTAATCTYTLPYTAVARIRQRLRRAVPSGKIRAARPRDRAELRGALTCWPNASFPVSTSPPAAWSKASTSSTCAMPAIPWNSPTATTSRAPMNSSSSTSPPRAMPATSWPTLSPAPRARSSSRWPWAAASAPSPTRGAS